MSDVIKITGLNEFKKAIKQADSQLPKTMRIVFNKAADVITNDAKGRVPVRTGTAARSLKSKSTQTAARVSGGSNKAPYYHWLDFGGKVGKGRKSNRPFKKRGRYIYASYFKARDSGEFQRLLESGLKDVAAQAGLELQ